MATIRKKARGRPRTGKAVPAAVRMRTMRQRRKAEGLRVKVEWVSSVQATAKPYSMHRLLDARSLAMHAVIAHKISHDPRLLQVAVRNLARWRSRWAGDPPHWFQEWQRLLARPWSEIASLLTEQSEHAIRLRQSTPFAGVLTPLERRKVYEAFRT